MPPACIWRSGVADAPLPGADWHEVAEGFCRDEADERQPDFPGLRAALRSFGPAEQHGAWHQIGHAFLQRDDGGTALLCFVEGLIADPDPSSANWAGMSECLSATEQAATDPRLAEFPAPSTATGRKKAASLAKSLGRRLGVARSSASSAVQIYNDGVRRFEAGEYEEAAAALESILDDEEVGLVALHLRGKCGEAEAQAFEAPATLSDRIDEAWALYVIYGLASRLAAEGAEVAITIRGRSCMMKARFAKGAYKISAATMMGSLMTMAWKRKGAQDVPLNDPNHVPTPSALDTKVIEWVRDAPDAPAVSLPWWTIPNDFQQRVVKTLVADECAGQRAQMTSTTW